MQLQKSELVYGHMETRKHGTTHEQTDGQSDLIVEIVIQMSLESPNAIEVVDNAEIGWANLLIYWDVKLLDFILQSTEIIAGKTKQD